jgi:hypothetical protein
MTSIIKVDTVQDIDGNNIISENANTITIGASGDTISIPAGATLVNSGTATGFGLTTQSVQTTGFTAVKGNLYPCNTTSAAFIVTLPASPSVGDQIGIVDYAGTFDTNKVTINPNSNKIEGGTASLQLTGDREGVTLTYIDSTQGWLATSGINEGTNALEPITTTVDFLVIAGGGAGAGFYHAGGGGAGGYRNSYGSEPSGGGGSSEASLTFTSGTVYTVTVGAGGTGVDTSSVAASGSNSSISGSNITTITSSGGGGGGTYSSPGNLSIQNGASGGSGGGAGSTLSPFGSGGSGTANQGFSGGSCNAYSPNPYYGGGGGGASAAGSGGSVLGDGSGGNGLASLITGSSVTRGGGGGGGKGDGSGWTGTGGTGGGGNGVFPAGNATSGTVNTGGGGGGTGNTGTGGNGGSGVVILRMLTSGYSGTTTGSPTVTTSGADTIIVFNSSGSITG